MWTMGFHSLQIHPCKPFHTFIHIHIQFVWYSMFYRKRSLSIDVLIDWLIDWSMYWWLNFFQQAKWLTGRSRETWPAKWPRKWPLQHRLRRPRPDAYCWRMRRPRPPAPSTRSEPRLLPNKLLCSTAPPRDEDSHVKSSHSHDPLPVHPITLLPTITRAFVASSADGSTQKYWAELP